MASTDEHLAKAKSNESFVETLIQTGDWADWGVTAIFYAAVHYGRALLAKRGHQISSHIHFQSVFERETRDHSAFYHFRRLQTASERARYDVYPCTWEEVMKLREQNLSAFKDRMRANGLETG